MARIGIDATSLLSQGKGITRYQKNIVEALSELASNHEFVVFYNSSLSERFNINKPNWQCVGVSMMMRSVWEQFQLPLLIRKHKLDIVHTAYDCIPLIGDTPFIIYLFEVPDYRIQLDRAKQKKFSLLRSVARVYLERIFPKSIRKTKLVVTSSDFTKQDLVEKYGIASDQIRVVQAAQDREFVFEDNLDNLQKIREEVSGGQEYVLHFSTGDLRDNTETVIRAYRQFRKKTSLQVMLVIVGTTAEQLGIEEDSSILFRKFAVGEELIRLYQGASAYLDPSLFEGFGFQLLEAMASGVPLIASNVTSIPEVVGDAGILHDPMDVEAYSDTLCHLFSNSEFKNDLRRKGIERAATFNWSRTAHQILDSIEQVVN